METGSSADNEIWSRLAPHLDAALGQLNEKDRDVLTLRFFERKTAVQIGQHLGLSAEVAQKRVTRGLERLRAALAKRGFAISSGALNGALSLNAVQAVPTGVTAAVAGSALASVQATATGGFTLFKVMALSKLSCGIATVILVSAVAVSLWHREQNQMIRVQNAFQQKSNELDQVRAENQELKERLRVEAQLPTVDSEVLRLRAQATQVALENARLRSQLDSQVKAVGQNAALVEGTASLEEILRVLRDQATTSEADSRRFDAAYKLKSMGTNALAGLPQFLELLRSGNQESAYAGARALGFTSAFSREALQHLTEALSDSEPQVRDAATHGISLLMTLGSTNLNGASVLPILVRNLQDSSQTVRADTANTLMTYIQWQKSLGQTSDAEVVIPALIRNLNDPWRYARLNAARALGEYGKTAREAVSQLELLLTDADAEVCRVAAGALQQITGK